MKHHQRERIAACGLMLAGLLLATPVANASSEHQGSVSLTAPETSGATTSSAFGDLSSAVGSSESATAGGSSETVDTTMGRARAVEVLTHGESTAEEVQQCKDILANLDDSTKDLRYPRPRLCPSGPVTNADVQAAIRRAYGDKSIVVEAYFAARNSLITDRLRSGDLSRFLTYLPGVFSS